MEQPHWEYDVTRPDGDRVVDLSDDLDILPDQTRDDTDSGWGEHRRSDDDSRYYEDRPPHWE